MHSDIIVPRASADPIEDQLTKPEGLLAVLTVAPYHMALSKWRFGGLLTKRHDVTRLG